MVIATPAIATIKPSMMPDWIARALWSSARK